MLPPERQGQLESFQGTIGYTFNNLQLLDKALTHKSYVNERTEPLKTMNGLSSWGTPFWT